MLKHVFTMALLCLPMTAVSVQLTATDKEASQKIQFMQQRAGTDHARMAAYVHADQAFTQWCGKPAMIKDLKRITAQEGFSILYSRLSKGQALGMTQTKALLMNDNPAFCKEKK
ncbi:hypothetical protein CRT22_23770 [Escherichia sp. E5028]|uniref:hypothetical protein n=1 Tax=Escherichia sp. E5028 TaxID=2044602 RepID=UPI00107F59B7|nr:hypothetical protein [Escherichia sp. E5028]TGB52833.1 hypothetical protein CRT22_23770 [Escherichia sp. E5028]